jgi:hypothetical protein
MLTLPQELTDLERDVLECYASFSTELFDLLDQMQFQSREHNGYGFYTNFVATSEKLASFNFPIGASALVDSEDCGFLLWPDCLEGFPLGGEAWPNNPYPLPQNAAAINNKVSNLRLT